MDAPPACRGCNVVFGVCMILLFALLFAAHWFHR